jgi:alkylhydroperoxidase family enzyme
VRGLFDLMRQAISPHGLTMRQRGILVVATASTLGDSYCSLMWGRKLTKASDEPTAVSVLRGSDEALTDSERALAAWARKVTRDPNGTDVQELRDAGYDDDAIFAITVFVALRVAFSIVNDALGARPDRELRTMASPSILESVTYGRPIAS